MEHTRWHAAMFIALSLGLLPIEVGAQSSSIVTAEAPPPTLAAWSERVFRDIDKRLRVREGLGANRTPSGIAAVKFNCSETGAPADVGLYKSSGFRELDRATLSAVRKVVTLHPLPAGLSHDQVFVVRVLFSNPGEAAERQIAMMRRQAAESNAWYGRKFMHTAALELAPLGG